MRNEQMDSKKVILGLIIGGVIGAGALYCMKANRGHQPPLLKKLSKTLTNVGEMLENYNLEDSCDVVHRIEDKLPTNTHIVSNVLDWVNTGMHLWKKFNKGA